MENKYVLPENLEKGFIEKGASVEIASLAEQNRQHSLWYGGSVATVKYKGITIDVSAVGDVIGCLLDADGNERERVKDKGNNACFYGLMLDYLKDDDGLNKALEDERLVLDYNNWWEFTATDWNGQFYEFFDASVADGVTLTEALEEVLETLDWWYESVLEEQALGVSAVLVTATQDVANSLCQRKGGIVSLATVMPGEIGVELVDDKIKFYDSNNKYLNYLEAESYLEDIEYIKDDWGAIFTANKFTELLCRIAVTGNVYDFLTMFSEPFFMTQNIEEIAKKLEMTPDEAKENELVNQIGDKYILWCTE